MRAKDTTFYEKLQNCQELDLRDNRGKRHQLAYVLLTLSLALLRCRDGTLSSIHRSMVNKNEELCSFLKIDTQSVISRAQLPLVLKKVSRDEFEKLLFDDLGISLTEEEKLWFAGDGKELRGSIQRGSRRGEVIVQLVNHKDRDVLGQKYYNGRKESEKSCLRELIKRTGAATQKITADALHLNPAMTELVNKSGGIFLIGLKGNQKELLKDMRNCSTHLMPVNQKVTNEKGHGRKEKRTYFHYDIEGRDFDKRWNQTGFKSLFKVIREREIVLTGKKSISVDFYISNGKYGDNEDYFTAIREHWSVEVNNHIRDVTLREDKLRTKINQISKLISSFRTLIIKLLEKTKAVNRIAKLEFFQDNFGELLRWLREIKFL